MFFRLINERYEKKSTIVTTNADFKYWSDIFSDNTLVSAILDKLLLRIKNYILILTLTNLEELKVAIEDYIYYYNIKRIKEKLKGLTPDPYRNQSLLVN